MNLLKQLSETDGSKQHIHFVGIAGCGMSGIAEILLSRGYKVSGSDLNDNTMAKRLKSLGCAFYQGHQADHINGSDLVVTSTAIQEDNPEVMAARKAQIPIIPRAQMLAELMATHFGIAIAGTHGKTTTTSLAASVLTQGKLDPTFIIGGLLHSAGSNAGVGKSDYIVAEADESDASFLYLKPKMAVVTNIDADHTWFYNNDFEQIKQTFLKFLGQLPDDGLAILCVDDVIVRESLPLVEKPKLTYGFSEDADVKATQFMQNGTCSEFVAQYKNERPFKVKLNMPGKHNVQNALATIAIAKSLKIATKAIQTALEKFAGVGRRFQIRGQYDFGQGHALLIDDYGHHPRELAATIEATKQAFPEQRMVMVFQPHRYSRTHDLFNDFVDVLAKADKLILLDTYPAGEKVIAGADGESLFQAVKKQCQVEPVFVPRGASLKEILDKELQDKDILVLQGAGDVGAMAVNLMEQSDNKEVA